MPKIRTLRNSNGAEDRGGRMVKGPGASGDAEWPVARKKSENGPLDLARGCSVPVQGVQELSREHKVRTALFQGAFL